jgi:phosphopantothenoylcysteine decarboxylase/phosphopantothenate--cysteine ligase
MSEPFAGRRILLGVTGGIGALKAGEIVTTLLKAGAQVRVMMTPEATRFITPLTLQALSHHPVYCDLLELSDQPDAHINLSEWAEAICIAPATANTLAKLARGLADDAVSATVLATRAPLLLVPAMNDLMWEHPATRDNLQVLRDRGALVVMPEHGRLASGKVGWGRLAEPHRILAGLAQALSAQDLAGWHVVVTVGGTREPIDPVRYVGNYSSGKMGAALVAAAAARGARVTAVSTVPLRDDATVVPVETAEEMLQALRQVAGDADLLLMAAAVADFAPGQRAAQKIKRGKTGLRLELIPTVDVLAGVRPTLRTGCLVIAFAAETQDVLTAAERKLHAKGVDAIVVNDVSVPGIGMGSDDNAVTLLVPGRAPEAVAKRPKRAVAELVLDLALELKHAPRRA